jgi:hypothetical protein
MDDRSVDTVVSFVDVESDDESDAENDANNDVGIEKKKRQKMVQKQVDKVNHFKICLICNFICPSLTPSHSMGWLMALLANIRLT